MPPGKQPTLKRQQAAVSSKAQSQLPPIPEKKSPLFWVFIVFAIAAIVIAGLYFSGRISQSPPLETVGIYSASGRIVSISPEDDSFVLEIEIPLRYQRGETTYVTQQKTVVLGEGASLFDEFGSITNDIFFLNANEGDAVYVSSGNFLNDISFSPDIIILHPDRADTEAGGVPEGEEAEIFQDIERSNFYIDDNE